MKDKSKKIIAGAIIIVLAITLFPTLQKEGFLQFKPQSTTGVTETSTWYQNYEPEKNSKIVMPSSSGVEYGEVCKDVNRATAWLTTTGYSQEITVQAHFDFNFIWHDEAGYQCGGNLPVTALGGHIYKIFLNGVKIIDTTDGVWYDSKLVVIKQGPNPDDLLGNGRGYKFYNSYYHKIQQGGWPTDHWKGGDWSTVNGLLWWFFGGSGNTNQPRNNILHVDGQVLQFQLIGQQTETLDISVVGDYAHRYNNPNPYGCLNGGWLIAGCIFQTDSVKLQSGVGKLEILGTNADGIQSSAAKGNVVQGSDAFGANPTTGDTGKDTLDTYTERIFMEGDLVNLAVTTGYAGEAPNPWVLAVWDAKGQLITSSIKYLQNNLGAGGASPATVTFQIPANCFDASLGLNTFTVVLTNGLWDVGVAYMFVVDTKDRLPGKATVTTDKDTYKMGETVNVGIWALSTAKSGAIKYFRAEARYDTSTGTVIFVKTNLPARYTGGRYEASYSFPITQINRKIYITANAQAGSNGEYPGPTADWKVISTITSAVFYTVTVNIKDIDGKAIGGAMVQLGSQTKTSNDAGVAIFSIQSGNYVLKITKTGYNDYTQSIYVSSDTQLYPTLLSKYVPNVDTDKDGVEDTKDNCPNAYNPDQADTNKNGIGDACENYTVNLVTVSIKVVNSKTGEGIAGCQVLLGDFTQWTDTTGLAIIENVPADTEYLLTVNDMNYEQYINTIPITQATTITVQLIPKSEDVIETTVSVPLSVKDTAGEPIEGATVTLSSSYTGTTDSTGNTHISVPIGNYDITVTKIGYNTGYAVCYASAGMETVNVILASSTENITNITANIQIIIHCTDSATSKSVADASVTIGANTEKTNSVGNAVFYLQPGSYKATITRAGYNTKTQDITVTKAQIFNIKLENAAKKTPGYELLGFIIALGITLILIKRKKKQ